LRAATISHAHLEPRRPSGGLLNTWDTFAGLAEEIGGLAGAGAEDPVRIRTEIFPGR
jgi:hypothetical protein